MTLLAVYQGKGCALIASDIMLLFLPDDQLALPQEKRQYKKLIARKFKRLPNGDLLAYHGRLRNEIARHLYNKGLDELCQAPLTDDPAFCDVKQLDQLYLAGVSVKDAQLYVGESAQPLRKLSFSDVSFGGHIDTCNALGDITNAVRSVNQKRDRRFLRELSDAWERYLIDAERSVEHFGGYESYILKPNEVTLHRRNPGKLSGCKSAFIDASGTLYVW